MKPNKSENRWITSENIAIDVLKYAPKPSKIIKTKQTPQMSINFF